MRRLATGLGVVALALATSVAPALAVDKPARTMPLKAAHVSFAPDFPVLTDAEWGFRLGGFGGAGKGAALHHVPVVFVHGNNVDAADWYPVQDDFKAAGWTDSEMFALSYNGLGTNNGSALTRQNPRRDAEHTADGSDGITHVTEDDVNVADLAAFVRAVQQYTGVRQFALVSHSLGVTLARETLRLNPSLAADMVSFVGIAGANHGTSFCPPGSEGVVVSCDEIAAGTAWLARLNSQPPFATPSRWLMVYDGTGAGDPAYAGPTYATSPALDGATLHTFPAAYHNDLRIDAAEVADYRTFLETAERPALAAGLTPSAPAAALPDVRVPALLLVLALPGVLAVARRARTVVVDAS